eukprot:6803445-Pyramimonas_sp.AAC.1
MCIRDSPPRAIRRRSAPGRLLPSGPPGQPRKSSLAQPSHFAGRWPAHHCATWSPAGSPQLGWGSVQRGRSRPGHPEELG